MKLYDKVKLKEDFKDYKIGTTAIIVEIFENKMAYLEILDVEEDTIGMLYCVPLSILEIV